MTQGLRIAPDACRLLNRRGVALLDLGRPQRALARFRSRARRRCPIISTRSAITAMRCSSSTVRPRRSRLTTSRSVRAPRNAQLLTNRAVALRRLDRPHEALASAARALVRKPEFRAGAFCRQRRATDAGRFRRRLAWLRGALVGRRFWRRSAAISRRRFGSATEPLDGKTILLHAEQGFGDTIQFVRYAPLVAARGAEVILEVQPRTGAACCGIAGYRWRVIARGEPLPRFDCHCPLLSLPLAFATDLTNIPALVPYLMPAEADVASWQARLPRRRGRLRIGLVWSGERAHDNDINRSLRLATLRAVVRSAGHRFRQSSARRARGGRRAVAIAAAASFGSAQDLRDFADTAAVIASLDAVISVDTAVAHLAGAMGKPLFLLAAVCRRFPLAARAAATARGIRRRGCSASRRSATGTGPSGRCARRCRGYL